VNDEMIDERINKIDEKIRTNYNTFVNTSNNNIIDIKNLQLWATNITTNINNRR
jgi:hypothetical protein